MEILRRHDVAGADLDDQLWDDVEAEMPPSKRNMKVASESLDTLDGWISSKNVPMPKSP